MKLFTTLVHIATSEVKTGKEIIGKNCMFVTTLYYHDSSETAEVAKCYITS